MSNTLYPGADEGTPSLAQYFSWVNNNNEGATERQTLINLAFFKWMYDTFGMKLDIYAFDAGAIDGAGFFGSVKSERFNRQFPRGFGPMVVAAAQFGCRLGIWGGPDGFGDTEEQARERIEQMVSLCRDHNFMLFKFDSVCGTMRPEKVKYFIEMMSRCRQHCPDLILLNHRLELGEGLPHATTFLWEGMEMYTDVYGPNHVPGTHNRVWEISRGLPPNLQRLTEDHGVCLSSSLDHWDDSLIQQAFNRSLILAPQIYGNPWLLRDDEFPRLARIFNLHRRYRDILVDGMLLPEAIYGRDAVSRGDGHTRFVSLRNLTWEPITIPVKLDETIGLTKADHARVRRMFPLERVLGEYAWGQTMEVTVDPFRACLVMVTTQGSSEIGFHGCDGQIIRDKPGESAELRLWGLPGTQACVRIEADGYSSATLEGEPADGLLTPQGIEIEFEGEPISQSWHRRLATLEKTNVPADADALYEATCFAAGNNALEVREMMRSGPTKIAAVQDARDAFFRQDAFRKRGVWDRYMFDGDPETFFSVSRSRGEMRIRGGSLRIDFGRAVEIDHLTLQTDGDYNLQPLNNHEAVRAAVSADLKSWTPIQGFAEGDIHFQINVGHPVRYVRLRKGPERINEAWGSYKGRKLDRTHWRASNLFAHNFPATVAWSSAVTIDEIHAGSFLAVPVLGPHVPEAVYAAARCGNRYLGAARRAAAYPCNFWQCHVNRGSNYTYFIPLDKHVAGKPIEVVLLGLKECAADQLQSAVWITAYPLPLVSRCVSLAR
ncbi:MAG: hypothetical protein GC164_04955 [Phycisphaera sp.]|nr:hypothetical protein [Phycisphaera sp.]